MSSRSRAQKTSDDDDEHSENKNEVHRGGSLSVKDAGVILTMSTLVSISLVTGILGFSGVTERLNQGVMEMMLTLSGFICLFTLISYLLVKMTAHYLVYMAVRIFFAICFPVSSNRQKRAIQEIYDKAEKRG